MLQIVIWMLCVYLVIKGVELRLIAGASPAETRDRAMMVSMIWMVIAILAAIFFFWVSLEQGSQMPEPPSFNPYGY